MSHVAVLHLVQGGLHHLPGTIYQGEASHTDEPVGLVVLYVGVPDAIDGLDDELIDPTSDPPVMMPYHLFRIDAIRQLGETFVVVQMYILDPKRLTQRY